MYGRSCSAVCGSHHRRDSPEALDRGPRPRAHVVRLARRSHGLDTKDRARIDDVVIVEIIVARRRDRLIRVLWDN